MLVTVLWEWLPDCIFHLFSAGRLRMKYELRTQPAPDKQAITAMAAVAPIAITLTGDITVCYAP